MKTYLIMYVNSVDGTGEITVRANSKSEAEKKAKSKLGKEIYHIINTREIDLTEDFPMNIVNTFLELDKINESQEQRKLDPVNQILFNLPEFEFEYEGFKTDGYEDFWNYSTGEPDQRAWDIYYPDFTYKIDAGTVFEDVRDFLYRDLDKLPNTDFWLEYKNVEKTLETAPPEKEAELCEASDLIIAKNLAAIVDYYKEELKDKYEKDALEWATENIEPDTY